MSVYSKPGKGWRYDFTLAGKRYSEAWFRTKAEAKRSMAKKREEVENPETVASQEVPAEAVVLNPIPTAMGFLELCNRRLDHVKKYNSESHFQDVFGHVRRWVKEWGTLNADQVRGDMIERYLTNRSEVSCIVANKELQYLRALFNFGIKKNLVLANPTRGLDFMPVEKRRRRIPPRITS